MIKTIDVRGRPVLGASLLGAALLLGQMAGHAELQLPSDYCVWEAEDGRISEPLCGLTGDPARGRAIAADEQRGNCLACHRMPIAEQDLQGTVGPPLHGVGSRLSEDHLRLRVVDQRQINPQTIMPGFYRDPRLANRVADDYWGKTFLSAQDVEDIIAYLGTLK